MTVTSSPIAEGCRVYIDFDPLPFAGDGSGRLVALSPFTIEWGQSAPWESPTPAVLSITLLDADGKYSASVGSLVGRRITIRPTWAGDGKPTDYAVFDGFITSATLTANETPYRIALNASDRMYVLLTDTAQQPNVGLSDAAYGKGWQWWLIGTTSVVTDRLKANGIEQTYYNYSSYAVPRPANEKVKLADVIRAKFTRMAADGTTYRLCANQPMYVHCWNDVGPTFVMQPVEWDSLTILTGARMVRGDGINVTRDRETLDAAHCVIDADAELSAPEDIYTQLQINYCHRSLTNANATDAQRQQESTYYSFDRDGARLVRIDGAARDGENVLSLDIEWCEYPNETGSTASAIDLTPTIDMLRESNSRLRLPSITVRSLSGIDRCNFAPMPRRLQIIGSKYEAVNDKTHGAWLVLGGTITYDASGRHGRWTHKMNLYPLHSTAAASATPTVADMARLDEDTFGEADWKIGALRYVTDCKPSSEVTA